MITILHITDKFGTDQTNLHGTGHWLARWVAYANERGTYHHELCSLRFRNAAANSLEQLGVKAHYLRTGKFNPLVMWRLWRLVKRKKPALLHLHEFGSQAAGRIVARLWGLPTVLHVHMADYEVPRYLRLVNRFLKRYTTRAIAVSEAAKQFAIQDLGITAGKIEVIGNGIDLAQFVPVTEEERRRERGRRGIPPGHYVVGCVGRFEPVKGQAVLIQAMALVVRIEPRTTCVLVGDGGERAGLEALADRLGLRGHVRFAGYSHEVGRWLSLFDVHVIPSLSEGFSLAAVEAMASGLPQVVSRVGALPDILEEGRTGCFVPPGDPEALAERLVATLRDPVARDTMGRCAKAAAGRYGIEAMTERIESLYASIVSPQGSAAQKRGPITAMPTAPASTQPAAAPSSGQRV